MAKQKKREQFMRERSDSALTMSAVCRIELERTVCTSIILLWWTR
jgi:hypothetical protein